MLCFILRAVTAQVIADQLTGDLSGCQFSRRTKLVKDAAVTGELLDQACSHLFHRRRALH
ncbi:hypothetical protein EMIT0P171_40358 [Pseudomonas sp. IT-P171]